MQNSKFSRYLLYAIGEIILVVIGILIAVWINQQVMLSNQKKEELVILKEIRANLEKDLIEIREDIRYMDTVSTTCDFAASFILANAQPSREFGRTVHKIRISPHFNFNQSGYNLLTSRGIKIIQKDSLRRAISDLYDSDYPYYIRYEKERIEFKTFHIDPVLNAYFTWKSEPDYLFLGYYEITNDDYMDLKQKGDFLKLLASIKRENLLVRDRAKRIKSSIIKLLAFLDAELTKK